MYDKQRLKRDFLTFWRDISYDWTQVLLTLEDRDLIYSHLLSYCKEGCTMDKVFLTFHAYANIAYLSAQRIVNAKIYFDMMRKEYILLSLKKEEESFAFCIVYSNISSLTHHPMQLISSDDMLDFVEDDDPIKRLNAYFLDS